MDGRTREIPDGSKTDQIVKAFKSALVGETAPERCITLLEPDLSTDSASSLTVSAMIRDAERDCIPGPNVKDRVLRPEALCQTAMLISMCSKLKSEARAKLVREIVTYHQSRKNRGNHQQSNNGGGDAEYWQERTEFHLGQSKTRGKRLRNHKPSDIENDMEARKKLSEKMSKEQVANGDNRNVRKTPRTETPWAQ